MRNITLASTESCHVEAYWVKDLVYVTFYLLQHTLIINQQERTYFDSGDFALSATDHMSDDGAIQTGTAHPHRESISHPYAPIPAASNVDKDANEDVNRKSIIPESSPLLQQTNYKNGELGAA